MVKRSKQVLIIANSIVGELPGLTGGEIRFIEIAKAWAKRGYEVHLSGSRGVRELCRRLGLEVTWHEVPVSTYAGRLAFLVQFVRSFFSSKVTKDFDEGIVYSPSEQIYDVIAGLLVKLRNPQKIKFVVVVHWLPPLRFWERKESFFLNSFLFLLSERLGLIAGGVFADKLLAVSKSTKEQTRADLFGRFFIKKTVAVKCGVDFSRIRRVVKKAKGKKYDAIFLKRVQAVKGIFDLVQVWKDVVKRKPRANLIVVGSGIDEEKARAMVVKEKLEKNIIFLGTIYDFYSKFIKLAEARLFLLPSYEENWAIVIGEAMSAGVPVISYDLKELLDVWKDNFVSIPVGNKRYFAMKVLELLDDKEMRDDLSKKALKFVKQFDWEKIADEEMNSIYNEDDNGR